MKKIINLLVLGLCSGVLVRCRLFQSRIFLLNDDKICEKNTSFDRSMIKLWEPVVRIIFYEINYALNRYKTCAVSVSANQDFTSYRIKTVVFRMI